MGTGCLRSPAHLIRDLTWYPETYGLREIVSQHPGNHGQTLEMTPHRVSNQLGAEVTSGIAQAFKNAGPKNRLKRELLHLLCYGGLGIKRHRGQTSADSSVCTM